MKFPEKAYLFFLDAVCLLYIFLFCYAAVSKLLDFENFRIQLGQSPLVSPYASFLSYAVPTIELVLAGLLCFKRSRPVALWGSMALMALFFGYIAVMLLYSPFVPCSCGGILDKLGWHAHLWFNGFFIVAALGVHVLKPVRKGDTTPLVNLFISAVIIVLAVLSNGALLYVTQLRLETDNPFVRKFPNNPVSYLAHRDLLVNSYYFAGTASDGIYLGNYTAPRHVTKFIDSLLLPHTISIGSSIGEVKDVPLRVMVLGNAFYLFNGTVPVLYSGRISDFKIKAVDTRVPYFSQLKALGSNAFAFKGNKSNTGENIIGLYRGGKTPVTTIIKKAILPVTGGDGFFDTDGMLLHNDKASGFVYLHRFSNNFVVLDTTGGILHRGKTIDSVSTPQVRVARSKGKQELRLASAPPYVNRNGTTWKNFLFVDAALRGRFDDKRAWRISSTIDVYDTQRNSYLYSFYIPAINGKKLRELCVWQGYVYVLYDTQIAVYKLN